MSTKITKEMEIEASTQKKELSEMEYRQQKINKFLGASNQDSTGLDDVINLAPTGYSYALISMLDEKNNPNTTVIYRAKSKGYREVPPDRHPELDMHITRDKALAIPCAIYKDCYIFEIESFILEARDKKELEDNKKRAEFARTGYNADHWQGGQKGIKNDWDKTNIGVEYGDVNTFLKDSAR